MTLQTPDLEAAKAIVSLQQEGVEADDETVMTSNKATQRTKLTESMKNENMEEVVSPAAKEVEVTSPLYNAVTITMKQQDEKSALVEEKDVNEETSKKPCKKESLKVAPIHTENATPFQCYLTMSPVTTASHNNKKRSLSLSDSNPKHHKKSKTFFIGGDQDVSLYCGAKNQGGTTRGKSMESFVRAAAKRKSEFVIGNKEAGATTPTTETTKSTEHSTNIRDEDPKVSRSETSKVPKPTVTNFVDMSNDPSDDEDETRHRVGLHSEQMRHVDAVIQKLSGSAQETFKAIAMKAISRHQKREPGYDHLPHAIFRNVQATMKPEEFMGAYNAVYDGLFKESSDATSKAKNQRAPFNSPPMNAAPPGTQKSRHQHYNGSGIRSATNVYTNQYAVPPGSNANALTPTNHYGVPIPPRRASPVFPYSPSPQYGQKSPVVYYGSRSFGYPAATRHSTPPHDSPMYEVPLSETVGEPTPATKATGSATIVAKNPTKKSPATKTSSPKKAAPKSALKSTAKPAPKPASEIAPKTDSKSAKETTPKATPKSATKKRTTVKDQDLIIPSKSDVQDAHRTGLQLALRYGYSLALKHGRTRSIHEILEHAERKLAGMSGTERDTLWANVAEYTKE